MTEEPIDAQIFKFPEKDKIAWHHIAPAIRNVALERSGSQEVADIVVNSVEQIYLRCVPSPIKCRTDSIESVRKDLIEAIHQITGNLLAEAAVAVTYLEMSMKEQSNE
jgi:hypothetical protein